MDRRRGLDRLITFADAVVAIALTLLVLPLVDIPHARPGEPLATLLRDNAGEIGAFFLSFVVIARLWTAHHSLLLPARQHDGVLLGITLFWLLTIVFLPFPTELLGSYQGRGVSALYIGTLLANAVALSATSAWLDRRPELVEPDARTREPALVHWVTAILLALAMVLAVGVPAVGMWALLLLFLSGPGEAVARRIAGATPAEPVR
jgi:uncharacterized membrane protein